MTIVDDATLEQLEHDPYPFYARLRKDSPVVHIPLADQWLVTRWDDCELLGRDVTLADTADPWMNAQFGPNLTTVDGDPHVWLRSAVDVPLQPRALRGFLAGPARDVTRRYVRRLRPAGHAEITGDLLEKISVRVIGNLLGVQDVEDDILQRWFRTLSAGMTNLGADPALRAAQQTTMAEIDTYMSAAVRRLTDSPDDSALSHMVHSGVGEPRPRGFADLIGSIRVIVLGGFQEPGHGASASLYGLLSSPEQAEAVRARPAEAIPLAVHEGLRWLSPFGQTGRRAVRDIEIGGTVIPAGARIALSCASANRDETRYHRADAFDLRRPRVPHAAFGWGAHFCSGHFVARLLEQIILEEVFSSLPGLRLDPHRDPVVAGWHVRGVKELPVVWDA